MRKFKVGSQVLYGEGGYEDYEEYNARIRRVVDESDGGCYYLEDENGRGLGYYDGNDLKFAPTKKETLQEKINRAFARFKMNPEDRRRMDARTEMNDRMMVDLILGDIQRAGNTYANYIDKEIMRTG